VLFFWLRYNHTCRPEIPSTDIRYNGGSVDSNVDPKDSHTHRTRTATGHSGSNDGKKSEIPPKAVTLSAKGWSEAHRGSNNDRGGEVLLLRSLCFWVCFIRRDYIMWASNTRAPDTTAGKLAQGEKKINRAIFVAFQRVTVFSSPSVEKDREGGSCR